MTSAPRDLTILVIGGGGREHAICWKLAASEKVKKIFCAPGNGGTAREAKTENVDIGVMDFQKLGQFAKDKSVDLIVVGPDDPIAAGAVDHFESLGLRVFGPLRAAATLEASKAFAKEFMVEHRIPTARFLTCDSFDQAKNAVREHPWARVIKADGLALGKGVFVCDNEREASLALDAIFREKRFGEAGSRVVLEERLNGEELSLLLFCDGKHLVGMPPCQDHKRRFDGDKGPNTGGMGAYSPVNLYQHCKNEIEEQVLQPLRDALTSGRLQYKGVLFIGLLIEKRETEEGTQHQPYVLEFNARFGDPETQTLLPLLESDLSEIFWACCAGTLSESQVVWRHDASCCVVAAADTYPEKSSKGETITIDALPPKAFVFQAGSTILHDKLVTNGGRVLAVVGTGKGINDAAETAYSAIKSVNFNGMAFRKDIGWRSREACLSQ